MPDHCFCEALGTGLIRQPANTWSSLAFVVVAGLVLWKAQPNRAGGRGGDNAMTRSMTYPAVYAAALLVTGAGSAFYHASLTFAGQFADVMGMYLLGTFILLYNWGRLRARRAPAIVASYLALNIVLAMLLFEAPTLRRYLFGALVAGALFLEWRVRRRGGTGDSRLLLGAVAAMVVAFAIWTLDLRGVICVPGSMLQGHAVWHVLGAVAAWWMYGYYRSDR